MRQPLHASDYTKAKPQKQLVWCAYCNWEAVATVADVQAHMMRCEKHPIATLKALINEQAEQITELRQTLNWWQNLLPEYAQTHEHPSSLRDMIENMAEQLKAKDEADVFVAHIKAHLQPHDFVVCKICGKTINEIWHAEQTLKGKQ